MNRYARQVMVPGVGAKGQARLAAAHVLVVGAGGLGCPVLQYLAGAGIGRITVIDPDHVEESNLHRQPLYRMADLGRAKVLAARDHLRAAHPGVEIVAQQGALHPAIANDLVEPADVVIDAADSFAVSYILSDACQNLMTPLISASVLGQMGYVGAYCAGYPSLRAIFPHPPDTGATCATAGVLGPAVGMVGALQAQIAMQLMLGQHPSPLGTLVTMDLEALKFGGFAFHDAPEPMQLAPFLSLRDIRPGDLVIDLRDVAEAPDMLVPSARRCPPNQISSIDLSVDQRLVLCCNTGLRAWRTASHLPPDAPTKVCLLAATACA